MPLRLRLAALCETVLIAAVRLLPPAGGRHRATAPPPHSPPPSPAPVRPGTPLVRPCLLAGGGHLVEVSA